MFLRDMRLPVHLERCNSFRLSDEIINYPFFVVKKLINFKWIKYRSIVTQIDQVIAQKLGQSKFNFYCQNRRHYFLNVIATNDNLNSLFFIEESMDAYLDYNDYNTKYTFKLKWPYVLVNSCLNIFLSEVKSKRIVLPDSPFENDTICTKSFYALTSSAFVSFVPRDQIQQVYPSIPSRLKRAGSNVKVLAFGALAEQGVMLIDDVVAAYKSYLMGVSQEEIVFIKFHPFQSENNKRIILAALEGWLIEVLPDNLVLEAELLVGNIHLISISSSLLLYAEKLSATNTVSILYRVFREKFVNKERLHHLDALYGER